MKRSKSVILNDIDTLKQRLTLVSSNPLLQPYRQYVPESEKRLWENFDKMLAIEQDKIIKKLSAFLSSMSISELEKEYAYIEAFDWWGWLNGDYWTETFLYWLETEVYPSFERGENVIHNASRGGKTKGVNYQPIYARMREDILRYHERSPAVSFTEIRKKVAEKVSVSEGAAKKNIKKADFPDW